MPEPIEVFVSFAAEDDELASELEQHLAVLLREGCIRMWNRRRIGPGEDWRAAVDRNIESSRLILLLISSTYLASDYYHDVEMKRALDRHQRGQARVIPIVLRAVDWRRSKFDMMNLAVLPENGKPITHSDWGARDRAWTTVATALRHVVADLQNSGTRASADKAHSYVRPHGGVAVSTPIAGAIPSSRSYVAVPGERPRWAPPGGWLPWLVASGGLVVLSAIVLAIVAMSSFGNRDEPISQRAAPAAPAAPTPRSQRQESTCAAPCCGGRECAPSAQDTAKSICATHPGHCAQCTSGRTCIHGPCGAELDSHMPWLLRLAHVTVPGVSANAQVCVKRATDPVERGACTMITNEADSPTASPGAAARTRLAIRTSDLLTGSGVDIAIWDGGRLIASTTSGPSSVGSNLLRSALCVGVDLRVSGGRVRFYLDDP